MTGWARIALALAPQDPRAAWYREVLAHAGLRVEVLTEWLPSELSRTHVCLVAGVGSLTPAQREGLRTWVDQGGHLVVASSPLELEEPLGLVPGSVRRQSVGYLKATGSDRLWPEQIAKMKVLGISSASVSGAQVVAECDGRPVVTRHRFGQGWAIYVGFDLGLTSQLLALGRSVECDGVGPSDPGVHLDDGVLRSEDGIALSFESDRTPSGEEPGYFGSAWVDLAREVWLRAVFEAIEGSGRTTPVTWYWPNASVGAATLSLDVRDSEVDRVVGMQRLLSMYGCPATWLVPMPGYAADVYRALRAMEHEVGLLYTVDEPNGWHADRVKIQFTNLVRLASWPAMGSVRAQHGQWRGWLQFYDACEAAGARVSLNKGGRQSATAGFAFGTCHPFHPVRPDGKERLVLEIPYQLWSPGEVSSEGRAVEIVNAVADRNGCLGFSLHPDAIADPSVSAALRRVLMQCKERRMVFMKADEVAKFERGRRHLRVSTKLLGESGWMQIGSEHELSGLTLMLPGTGYEVTERRKQVDTQVIRAFGTEFTAVVLDIPSMTLIDLEWAAGSLRRQAA